MGFLRKSSCGISRGIGVLALSLLFVAGIVSQAIAADGTTEIADGNTITATDAAGLLESDAAAAVGITIDSTGGAITLGADNVDSLSNTSNNADSDVTIAVTTSGTANGVIFADDITVQGNAGASVIINATNDNITFQGNISSASGLAADINIGSGGADPTLTVTIDTVNNENLSIEGDIDAIDAGDNVTLVIANTDSGNANTVAILSNIGSAVAIDAVTLGAATTATFTGTVAATTITTSSANVTTFNNDVTGSVVFAADGTVAFGADDLLSGGVTTGTTNTGTLTFATSTGGGAFAGSDIGVASTGLLTVVTADFAGQTSSFGGGIHATTITLTGTTGTLTTAGAVTGTTLNLSAAGAAGNYTFTSTVGVTTVNANTQGTVTFNGNVTGALVIQDTATVAFAADNSITGAITTDADGQGTLTFATATAATTLVSGNVGVATTGALLATTVNTGAGITSTLGGQVNSDTITVAGTGTLAITGAVTATTTLDITGAATVTLAENLTTGVLDFNAVSTVTVAANKIITGNVDAGAAGQGTLTFAATTTDSTLVSGSTGIVSNSLLAVNVAPASGVTGTFTGAVAATTVTNSGAGTLAYTGAMTGVTNLSGGGSVTVGGNHGGVIDNTSGSAGSGSATVAAGINVTGNIGGTNSLASVTFAGASMQTGSVAATTINVAGAGTTVAFTNFDVTGVLNFSAAGTATVTADEKIVGSVTTATTNTGTLTFATTTATTTLVSGSIGTSTNLLAAVTAASNNTLTNTFGGGINATTITLTGAGTASIWNVNGDINGTTLALVTNGTVNMADGQNVTANVTASGTNITSLTFAGTSTVTGLIGVIGGNELASITTGTTGVVTLDGNWAATTTTVQAGGTLKTTAARTVEGIVSSSGTLDLGGTLTTTAGGGTSDIAAAAATITLAPVSSYTSSIVISSTTTDIDATGTVTLVPDASFTSGTLTVVDTNAGGGTADNGTYAVTGNALASYAVTIDGSNDVILTATANSSSAIAASLGVSEEAAGAASAASTALGNVSSAQDVATQAAYNTAIQAGGATAKQAVEQIQGSPANLSAVGSAAVSATGSQVIAVGTSRLASLRSGSQFASSQASGFAGGAAANNYGIWMKPFVNFGDQDQRTGIAGYETDTYGIAMGGDVKVGDAKRTTLGISFSYANTDIDSKGAGRARTDINSYQGTLYADYTSNKWYVEGLVGFARNQIDTSRSITAGSLTAAAGYGSNQFMINIGGGMPMQIAKNHFITPNASFQYTLVENETYTETGAGALNLRVDQDEVHIAMGIFGARYHTRTEMKSGTLTPEIRTAVTYDFAGDEGQSTSTFNGGGAAFSVQGADVVQLGYTAGLGLSYAPLAEQGLTISANYDWNQKTDFIGHSANFALRYEF